MFHGSQSEPVFLHTSQAMRTTHTPNRFEEAAEMASPKAEMASPKNPNSLTYSNFIFLQ